MKYIYALIFITLPFFKIEAQSDTLTVNKREMEKFNITQFQNKDLVIGETYTDETKDSIIEYGIAKHDYFVRVHIKGTPYSYLKTYDKTSKLIMKEFSFFYKIVLLYKEYDYEGNTITEIDRLKYANISFTIEALINKMEKEYKIDILNTEGVSVSGSSNPPSFHVIIRDKEDDQKFRRIIIDGQTGQTISDEILQEKICDM